MTSNQNSVSSASVEMDDRSPSFTSPLRQMTLHFPGVSPGIPAQGVCTGFAGDLVPFERYTHHLRVSPFAKVTRQTCSFWGVTREVLRMDTSSILPSNIVPGPKESRQPTTGHGFRDHNFPPIPRISRLFPRIPGCFGSQKAINSFSYNRLPSCGHIFQKILSEPQQSTPPKLRPVRVPSLRVPSQFHENVDFPIGGFPKSQKKPMFAQPPFAKRISKPGPHYRGGLGKPIRGLFGRPGEASNVDFRSSESQCCHESHLLGPPKNRLLPFSRASKPSTFEPSNVAGASHPNSSKKARKFATVHVSLMALAAPKIDFSSLIIEFWPKDRRLRNPSLPGRVQVGPIQQPLLPCFLLFSL
jgi:hypothetical protein